MQDTQTLTIVLSSLFSIAGLWWLLFWLYRDQRIDRFRQEVFDLRDNLFDLAVAGAVRFDDPAYGMLRSTMNGFIRFGHRISLLQFLLFAFLRESGDLMRSGRWFEEHWKTHVAGLVPEVRDTLERLRLRLDLAVLKHVVLSSPLLVVSLVIPLAFWLLAEYFSTAMTAQLRRPLDRMDTAAAAYGNSDVAVT
jgi:hypothetical protein